MSLCCDCSVLSFRGLCVGLITRPEESYRVCVCVSECELEASVMRWPLPGIGSKRHRKKVRYVLLQCSQWKKLFQENDDVVERRKF